MRETVTSSRKMSHSGERPITDVSGSGKNVSPGTASAGADDQGRAAQAGALERGAVLVGHLLGAERLRVLARRVRGASRAPHFEQ